MTMDHALLIEEAEIAASETDAHMTESERERFIERFIDKRRSTFNVIPLQRDCVSHTVEMVDGLPGRPRTAVVTFWYPDGKRSYDGTRDGWVAMPRDPHARITTFQVLGK